ncbi:MAG: ABC transporter substrate-binding protein [Sedimenticolaceae bacterium]
MVRAAVICLALFLAACNPPETDTIVFAVATAPSVLDPRLASDAASERVNALLYDRLVALDEKGVAQPAMADWQRISPTRYRIRLLPQRAGFWDGSRPDARDVEGTYRSILDPGLGSPHASALAHVSEVIAVSDTEVDFHLSRPDPTFPSRLTIGIAPARGQVEGGLARRPMGSGPFSFLGWRDDGGLLLERRRDGQTVALVPVADPTMRALKLLRGEAQLLQNDLPSELYGYLGGNPALSLLEQTGTTFAYIGFNLADPVLANRDVRAAVAHAIDRDSIIRHLFDGRAQPAESILRAEHWAGAKDLQPYAYDPDLARSHLLRAGYDANNPLTLSYKTSTDPFRLRIAHVFQSQLAEVGIHLQIASYDWGTFFGDIKAGRFQIYSLAWVGVNTPDILRYAFHSESIPPGGANRGQYRSATVDELVQNAERAEPDAAAAIYVEIQHQVHRDLVYVPLWYESNVVASRGLEGYVPRHDGSYLSLNTVRIANAGR